MATTTMHATTHVTRPETSTVISTVATTPVTTTPLPTTFVCPTDLNCRCKPDAHVEYGYDSNGCWTCFCVRGAETTIAASTLPQTRPVETTTLAPSTAESTTELTRASSTTISATTPMFTTTFVCPTDLTCRCMPDAHVEYSFDANHCQTCFCVPNPTGAQSTAATVEPTSALRTDTAPASFTTIMPTTYTCPTIEPCHCRPDAHIVTVQDEHGCSSCYCAHNPTSAGTTLPATRPVPTTTAVERSGPAATCGPIIDCQCSATTSRKFYQDSNNCWQCTCVGSDSSASSATSVAPTVVSTVASTVMATSRAESRAYTTTIAETRVVPTNTDAAPTCGPIPVCQCSATTYREYFKDANNCWQCSCVSSSSSLGVANPSSGSGSSLGSSVSPAVIGKLKLWKFWYMYHILTPFTLPLLSLMLLYPSSFPPSSSSSYCSCLNTYFRPSRHFFTRRSCGWRRRDDCHSSCCSNTHCPSPACQAGCC